MPEFSSHTAAEFPAITHGEIHIWLVSLDWAKYDLAELFRLLADPECAKAQRFHFDVDRKRFIIGRGVLRLLLGHYLKLPPEHLTFCHNRHGKPFLDSESNAADIRFNVSHSSEIMLCAVTKGREIGIDIEYISPDIDVLEFTARFFSPQETAFLKSLPESNRTASFYGLWTVKEAYLKAVGAGIANGFDDFDVPLSVLAPLLREQKRETPGTWHNWSLKILRPAPGYIAAVVAEENDLRLKFWEWMKSCPAAVTDRGCR